MKESTTNRPSKPISSNFRISESDDISPAPVAASQKAPPILPTSSNSNQTRYNSPPNKIDLPKTYDESNRGRDPLASIAKVLRPTSKDSGSIPPRVIEIRAKQIERAYLALNQSGKSNGFYVPMWVYLLFMAFVIYSIYSFTKTSPAVAAVPVIVASLPPVVPPPPIAPPAPAAPAALSLPITSVQYSAPAPDCAKAPSFSVVTDTPNSHYFIKLLDAQSGQQILAAFIRGGETLKTCVPDGTYYLHYATGTVWYGEDKLFGSGTDLLASTSSLEFRTSAYVRSGHTVTLVKSAFGNFPTNPIPRSAF